MTAEAEEILEEFARKLLDGMRDPEPEIARTVNEHFWEMLEEFPAPPAHNRFVAAAGEKDLGGWALRAEPIC